MELEPTVSLLLLNILSMKVTPGGPAFLSNHLTPKAPACSSEWVCLPCCAEEGVRYELLSQGRELSSPCLSSENSPEESKWLSSTFMKKEGFAH